MKQTEQTEEIQSQEGEQQAVGEEEEEERREQLHDTAGPFIAERQLAFVFDIDGTLIAEKYDVYAGVQIRPGVLEFFTWCQRRGHRLALWTAAHVGWADRIAKRLCEKLHPGHDCEGRKCRKTFDFVWDRRHMRTDREARKYLDSYEYDGQCRWCDMYKSQCHRCDCITGDVGECACRRTKDLRRVWHREWYGMETTHGEITHHFKRENTLLLENTPQNCRYNYGNAIYVPTYTGGCLTSEKIFETFQDYVETTLETRSDNVRDIQKCTCAPPRTPHACCKQDWWPTKYKVIE